MENEKSELEVFNNLYQEALKVSKTVDISKDASIGSVGAALLNSKNHLYVGKNLDLACALGMCAERNAISTMLSHEVCNIDKLVCVHEDGRIISPCGACIEFMLQLGKLTEELKILVSLSPFKTVSLKELLTTWWRDELK